MSQRHQSVGRLWWCNRRPSQRRASPQSRRLVCQTIIQYWCCRCRFSAALAAATVEAMQSPLAMALMKEVVVAGYRPPTASRKMALLFKRWGVCKIIKRPRCHLPATLPSTGTRCRLLQSLINIYTSQLLFIYLRDEESGLRDYRQKMEAYPSEGRDSGDVTICHVQHLRHEHADRLNSAKHVGLFMHLHFLFGGHKLAGQNNETLFHFLFHFSLHYLFALYYVAYVCTVIITCAKSI